MDYDTHTRCRQRAYTSRSESSDNQGGDRQKSGGHQDYQGHYGQDDRREGRRGKDHQTGDSHR